MICTREWLMPAEGAPGTRVPAEAMLDTYLHLLIEDERQGAPAGTHRRSAAMLRLMLDVLSRAEVGER